MAPNPIMIPRQRLSTNAPTGSGKSQEIKKSTAILITSAVVAVVATLPWARRWALSGAGIESLALVFGASTDFHIFPYVPLWSLLAALNVLYAISSTSWLLYGTFTTLCYPAIALTCLFQFQWASDLARQGLRKLLVGLHFTRDTIALFDLPAMEIDTDVSGLFVLRGVSISLSSLRVVAHGLELGLKLRDDMELAIYVDEVDIHLFRSIVIGEVFANLKGGPEMTFSGLERVDTDDDDSIFQADTALLTRAATGLNDKPQRPRPRISRGITGGSYIKDSSVRESLSGVATLSPDDTKAEKFYNQMLKHIAETSHVSEARRQVEKPNEGGGDAFAPTTEKDKRAAICAKLHEMPSVPHPPAKSVRVTTLQTLSPPWARDFLHRLPFLLRLLLLPISYFHPVSISSITAAGSGQWLTSLLQEHIFKHYASQDAQIRRLERKISTWLAAANFSVQLCDVAGLGQVPLSAAYDIVTYLQFADIIAFRTVPESGMIREVARLGGADATFTIPSFLLPHHEHLIPAKPKTADLEEQVEAVEEADGMPKTVQAEKELEKMQKDETEVSISVHASLPACFDQSLLNFVAALVKATKVIELEKTMDEASDTDADSIASGAISPTDSLDPVSPPPRTGTGFKNFAAGIRQNIKDNTTSASIKEFARDLHQSTKDGMKKAVVGGMINDRWIAKLVGKVAAKLEQAQGDLGYSGAIPIPLAPYRGSEDLQTKLLP